ncbi:MAG: hypothetical protein EOP49_47455 [Sphingobacteriales bacterium]|nr:MAG: hypothetical protein EOP49_47455 [Sphingobacteriales bacterium]
MNQINVLRTIALFFCMALSQMEVAAQDFGARFKTAYDLGEAGKIDEGIAGFTALLKEQPFNSQVHCQLGWLLLKKKQFTASFEHMNTAVELAPTDIGAFLCKSYVLIF